MLQLTNKVNDDSVVHILRYWLRFCECLKDTEDENVGFYGDILKGLYPCLMDLSQYSLAECNMMNQQSIATLEKAN